MILYLDTSALVKRYFLEDDSSDVMAIWKSAGQVATSFVAYAETMACIHRKQREGGIAPDATKEIITRFKNDWQSFIRVKVNADLCGRIDRVVAAHPLRGFDAIHLASALAINEHAPHDLVFACFDTRLLHAAAAEGLATFPSPSYD